MTERASAHASAIMPYGLSTQKPDGREYVYDEHLSNDFLDATPADGFADKAMWVMTHYIMGSADAPDNFVDDAGIFWRRYSLLNMTVDFGQERMKAFKPAAMSRNVPRQTSAIRRARVLDFWNPELRFRRFEMRDGIEFMRFSRRPNHGSESGTASYYAMLRDFLNEAVTWCETGRGLDAYKDGGRIMLPWSMATFSEWWGSPTEVMADHEEARMFSDHIARWRNAFGNDVPDQDSPRGYYDHLVAK